MGTTSIGGGESTLEKALGVGKKKTERYKGTEDGLSLLAHDQSLVKKTQYRSTACRKLFIPQLWV